MDRTLLMLHRHKMWATLRLIERCQVLDEADLDATIPGTYGSIRATLRHMVDSDEDYFRMLTGVRLSEPLPEGPIPLEELSQRVRDLGPRWEDLADDDDLQTREITADDGWHWPGAVGMAQAIHHANDHHTQILSILGARGLEVPDLDVWSYARAEGSLQPPG